MKPGTLAIKQGESTDHLATTHVGRGGYWTEAGVIRWLANTNWNLFTYDNDEGQWSLQRRKNSRGISNCLHIYWREGTPRSYFTRIYRSKRERSN